MHIKIFHKCEAPVEKMLYSLSIGLGKKRCFVIGIKKPVSLEEFMSMFKNKEGKEMRRNKRTGRFSDKLNYSGEPHERRYVRQVAKRWIPRLQMMEYNDKVEITAGQLQRLCEYIKETEVVKK